MQPILTRVVRAVVCVKQNRRVKLPCIIRPPRSVSCSSVRTSHKSMIQQSLESLATKVIYKKHYIFLECPQLRTLCSKHITSAHT